MNRQTWQPILARPQMWFVLAQACLAVMELTLFSLWYQGLFNMVPLAWPAQFGLLATVGVTSYALAKGMQASGTRLFVRQAFFLAWISLALLGTLRIMIYAGVDIGLREMVARPIQFITFEGSEGAAFFHLLAILALIWRAVSLTGSQVSVYRIQVSFQLGLILLLIYGIAQAFSHPVEAIIGLFLYLFFALVSMSSARIASLAEARGGRVHRFSAGWLAGILLTGLGVVGLSILVGWLASGRLTTEVIKVFIFISTFFAAGLLWILTPVVSLLARMIAGLFDLIERISRQAGGIRLPRFLENLVIEITKLIEVAIPGIVAGRVVLLAALLILLLAVILVSLRFHSSRANPKEEENSHTGENQETRLWRKILQRLVPTTANLRRRSPGQLFAAARIRRIYRQLMALSQKHGAGRLPSQTPLEFLPRLEELFPAGQEDLSLITSAYVKVRYGEYPETLSEVGDVQRAWDRIRRQARKENQGSASAPTIRRRP